MAVLGLLIYLFNLYIRPQDWVSWMYGMPVDYIVIIFTFFLGVFLFYRNKKFVKLPQYYLLSAFVFTVFLSNALLGQVGLGVAQLITFFKLLVIFFMFPFVLTSRKKLTLTLKYIAFLSAVLAYQGIFQSKNEGIGWAGQTWYSGWAVHRIVWVGQWDGANIFAFILLISVPFFLGYFFNKSNILLKILSVYGMSLILYAVYLTNSRGGYISLVVVVCCYVWMKFKKKFSIILILGLLAIAAAVVPSRMAQVNTQEESAYYRTWVWKEGFFMMLHNPLFGIGKGFFEDYSHKHLRAHNSFVQTYAETGLVGFFFWLGAIYFSFKGLYKVMKRQPLTEEDKSIIELARVLFISLIGFNVCSMLLTIEDAILYVWLGLCAALISVAANHFPDFKMDFSFKDIRNIIIGIVVVIGIIYLIAFKNII